MPIHNNIDNIVISEIDAEIKRRIEKAEKSIIRTLQYIGETCINEARLNGNYMDQTGNLRSSIGYVILNNGSKVKENIKKADKGTDKNTGVNKAKQFLDELSAKYDKCIVLIVVAGMNYATLVETRRNVLASAKLLAERETPRMMFILGFIKRAL
jgi:hypothetical protein